MKKSGLFCMTLVITLALILGGFNTISAEEPKLLSATTGELVEVGFLPANGQYIPEIEEAMEDVIAFDISKGQYTSWASDFIDDLQAEGFTVAYIDIESDGIPENVMKLIILGASGEGFLVDSYTDVEGAMIEAWVDAGGEVMIVGEHGGMYPEFIDDMEELMLPFDVTPEYTTVYDTDDYDVYTHWVIYQSDNFEPHPILYDVTSIEFPAGGSFVAGSGVIIRTDDDGSATPDNVPVVVAKEWGNGRVTVFGDYNWLTEDYNKEDNAIMAMNTIYWLNARVIDPLIVEESLLPGETLEVEKRVTTPPIPLKPDIYFLCDTTGSMGDFIAAIQTDASTIMADILAVQPDAQFGVGDYKDFPYDTYCFDHKQSLTGDTTAVDTAIGLWSTAPGEGFDQAEGQFYAFTELATNPAIGWRTDSTKIVVWFGDAPAHDPVPIAATGYGYEVTEATVITDLQAAGISVIAINTITGEIPEGLEADPTTYGGNYATFYTIVENGAPGQATRITDATGGAYMLTPDPADVAIAIIDALEQVVTDVWWDIVFCDPELTVTLTPLVHEDVPGGITVDFTETIEVADDAEIGTYICIVDFYANHVEEGGLLIGTQEIIIHVDYNIDKHFTYTDVDFTPYAWEPIEFYLEDFEDDCPPVGWSIYEDPTNGDIWTCSNVEPASCDLDGASGIFMKFDDDMYGDVSDNPLEELITGPIDCSIYRNIYLSFDGDFEDMAGGGMFWVHISNDGGVTWTEVLFVTTDLDGGFPAHPDFPIDISSMADFESDVRIKFTYSDLYDGGASSWGWGVLIDNIRLNGEHYVQQPAELGTPLNSIDIVVRGKNPPKVKSTNPGQLYSVITITGPVEEFVIKDYFDIEFDVNPAKLYGGIEIIKVDPDGYATVITGSPGVNLEYLDNTANWLWLIVTLDEPLPFGYKLMIYVKYQTSMKHQPYTGDDHFWNLIQFWYEDLEPPTPEMEIYAELPIYEKTK